MTTCADSTALRAHLDHPEPALEAHLDTCGACTGLLTAIAADAGLVRRAFDGLDADVPTTLDIEGALAAVARDPDPAGQVATPMPAPRGIGRAAAGIAPRLAVAAVVALLAVVVGLTPVGRSAVAQALDGFRGEQLQVVQIDPASLQLAPEDFQALASLGELDLQALEGPSEVTDMAAAEELAGITGPTLADAPDHLVASAASTVSLTLVERDGNGIPAELDGAVLQLGVPGVIGAVYGEADMPSLVIGRSGAPLVEAVGAPLADVRAFLLARPELPESLRTQLAAIEDWQSTLPIPAPVDGPGWEEVTIGDRPGLAFGDGSGLGAVVLREDADGLTVVGGTLPIDEVLAIAAGA